MEILELLRNGMSKADADFIAGLALKDSSLVTVLWKAFLSNREPVSRKAAWVLDHLTENHPELVMDFLPELIDALPGFKHDGLTRHALHIIGRYPILESKKELLLNYCFEILLFKKEAVAVRAFALQILYQISLEEPEIRNELISTLEFAMEESTPGMRSLGSKILKKLYKDNSRPVQHGS